MGTLRGVLIISHILRLRCQTGSWSLQSGSSQENQLIPHTCPWVPIAHHAVDRSIGEEGDIIKGSHLQASSYMSGYLEFS